MAAHLAAQYIRMSTDKQEASIPAQREAVQKYAADNGYQIIREYIDEGISGDATEKRHQFRRMIADAEILTHSSQDQRNQRTGRASWKNPDRRRQLSRFIEKRPERRDRQLEFDAGSRYLRPGL